MVQQLNKRERQAHRAEFGDYGDNQAVRIRTAIDRENQANPSDRERVITYRAVEAAGQTARAYRASRARADQAMAGVRAYIDQLTSELDQATDQAERAEQAEGVTA